jgi:methionyl aminopeptidase
MVVRKTQSELEKMRAAGLLVYEVLKVLEGMTVEGVNTLELELAAERMIRDAGARPAFKNYFVPAVGQRYKYVLCTSVNDEIVHGLPSDKRILKSGDVVSIDTGAELNGYFGDSAITVPVGQVTPQIKRLLEVTKESLERAIEQVRPGNRLFDVCGAVERYVVANGFGIIREYVGHGIGTQLHEEPQVPNYVDRNHENPRLKEGMVLAIEPMISAGKPDTKVAPDKWTAKTKDGSYSAHFEHCVAVTADGPWVLTRP